MIISPIFPGRLGLDTDLLALGQAYQNSSNWHDLRPIRFRPGFIPNAYYPFDRLMHFR